MNSQQPNTQVTLPAISLPKGGGAITGIRQSIETTGVTGQNSLTIPLPLTPGRGHDPVLAIAYASQQGQSPFGLGWDLTLPAISLRTHFGVPDYDHRDQLLAPNGDVLVACRNSHDEPQIEHISQLAGETLATTWAVETFMPRIIDATTLYQRWTPVTAGRPPFWLVRTPDGMLAIYGFSSEARVADAQQPQHIARWLLEETVAPNGEHIYYHYRTENDANLNDADRQRDYRAQRYLQRVCYGNLHAQPLPFVLSGTLPEDWMFELWFDYGEYPFAADTLPVWNEPVQSWPRRAAPFSRYHYGFEIRTLRLCRQVIMYHRFAELGALPQPVARLRLHHEETAGMTLLKQVDLLGHRVAGETEKLPAIRYQYSRFDANASAGSWQSLLRLADLCESHHYQWVDLWGEGLPGILYQASDGWRYRAPIRDEAAAPDGVDYGPEQPLPLQPVGLQQQSRPLLTDMTGDGFADWVVALPDMAGFFTANAAGEWSNFIPWKAFPSEFAHPDIQLAALGGYLNDISLIGPRSVRLYSNQRETFSPAHDIPHDGNLPLFNASRQELVAFSDVLGSGQPHLVRVRHNAIHCWPNLGQGRFGQPLLLGELPCDSDSFNPDQVSLADLDGNGAADLIIATAECLLVFLNQSGNGFAPSPLRVPLPQGERIDNLSQLHFADLKGNGYACIILSQPHPQPRHYQLDFSQKKPWLLQQVNDPSGCDTHWEYRSSAQEWLDEKATNPATRSHLPFPLHLLKKVQTQDLISGNTLTQTFEYREGWYDGYEREFNGFAQVTQFDTESAGPLVRQSGFAAPLISRNWYYTGAPQAPNRQNYWQDADAIPLEDNLQLLRGAEGDVALDTPEVTTQRSLDRALKGRLLRQEIFSDNATIPYRVSENRYLLRVWQTASQQDYAQIQPVTLESRQWRYDGIGDDPQATHEVLLRWDRWGQPLQQVNLHYPRRQPLCPYDAATPQARWWQESFDEQQNHWQLQITRQSWLARIDDGYWRLGLTAHNQAEALSIPGTERDARQGVSFEFLNRADSWLQDDRFARSLLHWQQLHWQTDAQNRPLAAGLLLSSQQGELDEEAISAWQGWLEEAALADALRTAHYLPGGDEAPRWLISGPVNQYAPFAQFYRLEAQRASDWLLPTTLSWDDYSLQVMTSRDPLGLETHASYDYRLMAPVKMIDPQGTCHEAAFDALGRVRATSFYGMEYGHAVGFPPLARYFLPANDFTLALQNPAAALGERESVFFYAPDNLVLNGEPIFSAVISADRYPNDADRQIRISITFCDGFGRVLQNKQRVEAGEALTRDELNQLRQNERAHSDDRWRVSERVEYNNKGQPVRQFQPYFVAGWRYASDSSMREKGWYSCLWYDAAGRLVDTLDGRWHWSRMTYHPWYQVMEDANDTAGLTRPDWLIGCPNGKPLAR